MSKKGDYLDFTSFKLMLGLRIKKLLFKAKIIEDYDDQCLG